MKLLEWVFNSLHFVLSGLHSVRFRRAAPKSWGVWPDIGFFRRQKRFDLFAPSPKKLRIEVRFDLQSAPHSHGQERNPGKWFDTVWNKDEIETLARMLKLSTENSILQSETRVGPSSLPAHIFLHLKHIWLFCREKSNLSEEYCTCYFSSSLGPSIRHCSWSTRTWLRYEIRFNILSKYYSVETCAKIVTIDIW